MRWQSAMAVSLLAVLSVSVRADVVSMALESDGETVKSIVVDRDGTEYTYTRAELIGLTLDAFEGDSGSVAIIADGDALPGPGGGKRSALIEDDSVLTGVINQVKSATAVQITFDEPVINSDGVDLLFFEIDPDGEGDDGITLEINGVEKTYTVGVQMFNDAGFRDMDLYQADSRVTTKSELDSDDTFSIAGSSPIWQGLYGVGIDLDDFTDGSNPTAPTSVTTIHYGSAANTSTSDPMYIVGLPEVPEPAAATLLAFGALGVLLRRRRRA